jgi:hypothetical protein
MRPPYYPMCVCMYVYVIAIALPSASIYIKNATLWSAHWVSPQQGDMLLADGKIKEIYTTPTTPPAGATIIDAQGRFVTPGNYNNLFLLSFVCAYSDRSIGDDRFG